ncbi:hypothetical protein ABK040_016141 [Willaertia magna]
MTRHGISYHNTSSFISLLLFITLLTLLSNKLLCKTTVTQISTVNSINVNSDNNEITFLTAVKRRSFTFYINSLSNNTEDNNKAYNCDSEDNPCRNFCQAINYLNNYNFTELQKESSKQLVDVTFYLKNSVKERFCSFDKIDNIYFTIAIEGPFVKNLEDITTTIDMYGQLIVYNDGYVDSVTFRYLNVINLRIMDRYDTHFLRCFVNLLECEDYGENSFTFFANGCTFLDCKILKFKNVHFILSTLQSSEISNFETLSIYSSTISPQTNIIYKEYNNDITNGQTLTIDKCIFEVLEYVISSVQYVTIKETNFKNNITIANKLDIRYSDRVTFINCNSNSIGEWLLIRGTKYISFDNMNTTGSVEVVFAKDIYIKNSLFESATINGLKVFDVDFISITKTNFINCINPLTIENTHSFYPAVEIDNCFFIENKATQNGGAISSNVKNGVFRITNSMFTNNFAKYNGGALYINMEDKRDLQSGVVLSNCVLLQNKISLFVPMSLIKEGNGGGAYISGGGIDFNNVQFDGNIAVRGGGLYTDSIVNSVENGTLFTNDYAVSSGSGIFSNNLQTLNKLDDTIFVNETGKAKSSFTFRADVTYKVDDKETKEIVVFPGQTFDVILKPFDVMGNHISQFYEPMTLNFNFKGKFVIKQVFSQPNGITRFYLLKEPSFNFTSKYHYDAIQLLLPIIKININLTITHCPGDYTVESEIGTNLIYCQRTEFPVGAIIALSIVGAMLFFLVGLTVGVIIIYTCFKVIMKLRKLELKEKAELEIEQKIIDKKVIFGDNNSSSSMNSSLLKNDALQNNNSMSRYYKKKDTPSFLIPVEEIKIQKKIGEGGCGTVYSAKWGDNTVAIKSIKISDDNDEENEDFEREVSLLSSLRHPNIVTFYGVTITDKSKYMVIEYLNILIICYLDLIFGKRNTGVL